MEALFTKNSDRPRNAKTVQTARGEDGWTELLEPAFRLKTDVSDLSIPKDKRLQPRDSPRNADPIAGEGLWMDNFWKVNGACLNG
jgi:hypothetical protein